MAATLVLLAQAKAHLRIDVSTDDTDIQAKLDQAEDIILRYLKSQADAAWTPATVPLNVTAAILIMLSNLYENRGDDESFGMSGRADGTWAAIERLLVGLRDPALA